MHARRSKSRAPAVTMAEIRIPLGRQHHPDTAALLMQHVVKQLLFMRHQMEQVYPVLLETAAVLRHHEHSAEDKPALRKRASRDHRRLLKFVDAVERLLSSVRPEVFTIKPVTRVVLLFGTSPHRPCEVYDICVSADQHAEPVTEPAALLHSLTRSLVAAAADMSEGPASKGPSKLHMLALLRDSPTTEEMTQHLGLRAKRGFVLKQKRGQYVRVNLGCPPEEEPAAPADPDNATVTNAQCTWYQADSAPRGLTRAIPGRQ